MNEFNYNDYDRHVYETELRDFLPDKLIDCHTHVWKESFPRYGVNANKAPDPTKKIKWTSFIKTKGVEVEEMLGHFKTLYPDKEATPLVFGSCGRDIQMCNDYVGAECKRLGLPGLLRSDYAMTPDFLEEEMARHGLLGLKPYLTNHPAYIPASEVRIFDFLPHSHLEAANKNGWIVMLHIPRAKRLRDALNIAQIMEIEEKYPDLKLVVAHIGRAYSKEDLGDAFDTLKNTKNLVFDFTANLCDDAIKACIEACGTKRLLFGTDAPIAYMRMYRIVLEDGTYCNVVPKGFYGDGSNVDGLIEEERDDFTIMIYEQLRALKRVALDLKLRDSDIEDIMYNNSKRLIYG